MSEPALLAGLPALAEVQTEPVILDRHHPEGHEVVDQRARTERRLGPESSLAPQPLAEAARALLAGAAEGPRRCQQCGQVFTGRATRRTCSGKCRAAMSRQRQSEARAERDREIRALLLQALRLLDEAPSRVVCRRGQM
jgi:hypothetical protein